MPELSKAKLETLMLLVNDLYQLFIENDSGDDYYYDIQGKLNISDKAEAIITIQPIGGTEDE